MNGLRLRARRKAFTRMALRASTPRGVCGGAEQILCVRSDPIGDHQPTAYDIEDARRVKRALDLLVIPLGYVIVGRASGRFGSGE